MKKEGFVSGHGELGGRVAFADRAVSDGHAASAGRVASVDRSAFADHAGLDGRGGLDLGDLGGSEGIAL